MRADVFLSTALTSFLVLLPCLPVRAQGAPSPASVELVVETGRPLRIALSERVRVARVGQPITGTLIDPVYAYDRIVVPAGTVVGGHVDALDNKAALARVSQHLPAQVRGPAGGGLDMRKALVVRPRVLAEEGGVRENDGGSGGSDDGGPARASDRARDAVEQAKQTAAEKARSGLAAIRSPGKRERMKAAVIGHLPYHPQYVAKGTVYDAELVTPLDFGPTTSAPLAPPGSLPAPNAILNARLVTPLDSAHTPRGTPLEAIVTEPVFSQDRQLVLPEGSKLIGEVTFAAAARRFHRSGQLRFLVESVQPPRTGADPLLASLSSVQVPDGAAVDLDEEGGARASDSKKRFIAPALSLLALRASTHREARRIDNDADDSVPRPAGSPGSRGVGGFFGWGLAGALVSQLSRPVGLALATVGVARTVYRGVFARGHEVTFPADTMIQVQLAPASPDRP